MLAAIALIALLHEGQSFFIPVVLAILISYTLRPSVQALQRLRVPAFIGAALVLAGVLGAVGGALISLQDDALSVIEQLPQASRTLKESIRNLGGTSGGPLAHLTEAAEEIEAAASAATGAPERADPVAAPGHPPRKAVVTPDTARPPQVAAEPTVVPALMAVLRDQLSAAARVLVVIATATLIAYFLLASGDHFRRVLMHSMGPTLSARRQTVDVLREVNVRLGRYLVNLVLSNLLIAVLVWAWLAWFGVSQAPLWGVLAGLLHVVPYVGTTLIALLTGVIALAQLGTVLEGLWVGAGAAFIAGVIGMVAGTLMQGRACLLHPAASIVALTGFGALWGGWGLLLALPLLAVVKTIGDHLDEQGVWVRWLGPSAVDLEIQREAKAVRAALGRQLPTTPAPASADHAQPRM